MKEKTSEGLDDALEDVQVVFRGMADQSVVTWWPESLPWAVSDVAGVLALFRSETAARQYRLSLIAARLNPGWSAQE